MCRRVKISKLGSLSVTGYKHEFSMDFSQLTTSLCSLPYYLHHPWKLMSPSIANGIIESVRGCISLAALHFKS